MQMSVSVVTPTLGRPIEVAELVENLSAQTCWPAELVIVDGAGDTDRRTAEVVGELGDLPFAVRYIRHGGGTAVQRNVGIEHARGELIAFIDDDIRLEPDFLEEMGAVFDGDVKGEVGGVAGYITNQHLDPEASSRWRWYRRLHLFSTYEPGRYDIRTGYPINRYLQPPHDGLRPIDFMGAGCAVWRGAVFADGLRFDPFFASFGVLEDAHLALRARKSWTLLENGRAKCRHLRSQRCRENEYELGRKSALNYRFVFLDIVPERSLSQEARFWLVQLVDLGRFVARAGRRWDRRSWRLVRGKIVGIAQAAALRAPR